MLDKMLELPILFVSEYINKNKALYYQVLKGVTEKGEWKEYIIYMLDALETQATITHEQIIRIKDMLDDIKETIHELKMPEKLGDLIFSYPIITITKVKEELEISRQTASGYLKKLEDAGKLESSKLKKELLFFNRSFIKSLSHS